MIKNIEILINDFNSGKLTPKEGTLKIFNCWFGKPYDNLHKISSIRFLKTDNVLEIIFDEGEKLSLWNPSGLEVRYSYFKIKNASKIKWEWYLYGEEEEEINKRFWEFKLLFNFVVDITTNDNDLKSGLRVKLYKYAFEIL